jgi:integrase
MFDAMTIKGTSPSWMRTHRLVMNMFFVWAFEKGFCIKNPVEVKNPKLIPKLPRYFSEEELQQIFEGASVTYKPLYKFLYLTGLRFGEASNLEWSDYDKARKHLIIRAMEGNKTKRDSVVQLNTSALAILEERNAAARAGGRYIFTAPEGGKIRHTKVYGNLKKILDKNDIRDASLHTFRHTCASALAIRGVSLYTIKEILRHASFKETERYAHLSKEAVASAVEILTA